jgi:mRNA interferase RelE/StbE
MKQVGYTSAAYRQLAQAERAARTQIDQKMTAYADTGSGDVKALKGVNALRLRAGDWRVIFTVESETITIHAVGHRRDIYD